MPNFYNNEIEGLDFYGDDTDISFVCSGVTTLVLGGTGATFSVPLFGDGSGLTAVPGSATTVSLQDAYNNGNEIITTTGVTINFQNGQGNDLTNTIQFKNNSGDITGSIRADGRVEFSVVNSIASSGSNTSFVSKQSPLYQYVPTNQTTGTVGQINFQAWNGADYVVNPIGAIRLVAEEYYTGGTYGTSMYFRGTNTGSTTNGIRMVLHANGNTGIGTLSNTPTAKLHINNTSTSNSFLVEDSTSPDSSPFVIDSAGFVGIGMTSPIRKLDVTDNTIVVAQFQGTNAAGLLIDMETVGSSYNGFRFYSGGTHKMSTTYIPSAEYYQIGTSWAAGNEIMVVTRVGSVGIGTTTPSQKLEIIGNTLISGSLSANSLSVSSISASTIVGPQPYTLSVQALTSTPTSGATRYFGNLPKAPVSLSGASKVYVPKNGIIKRANIYSYAGTAGTSENWSLYIRINNTTDYLIETIGSSTNERIFNNESLNIDVTTSDYFEIKMVNPTWVTNPATAIFGGYIYIE